jgi:hypothetical protein
MYTPMQENGVKRQAFPAFSTMVGFLKSWSNEILIKKYAVWKQEDLSYKLQIDFLIIISVVIAIHVWRRRVVHNLEKNPKLDEEHRLRARNDTVLTIFRAKIDSAHASVRGMATPRYKEQHKFVHNSSNWDSYSKKPPFLHIFLMGYIVCCPPLLISPILYF